MNRSLFLGWAFFSALGIAAAPVPEFSLQYDRKNIEGFWMGPADPDRDPIILRFHKGHLTICEYRDSSHASSTPAYDLQQRGTIRVICGKDGKADKEFITYQLLGDKLILDDESSPMKWVNYNLKGEWRRIK